MEQYTYQQQVIMEPAPAKKPIGLQVTALILGIVAKAKNTEKSGSAIAGIVISVFCIILSGAFGVFFFTPNDAVSQSARDTLLEYGISEREIDAFLSEDRSLYDVFRFIMDHSQEIAEKQMQDGIDGLTSEIENRIASELEKEFPDDDDWFADFGD